MLGAVKPPELSPPAWKEWKRVFCWEEEPVLAGSMTTLQLPASTAGLRRIGRYYRRLEGQWAARWERSLYPQACGAARQARAVSHPFRPWEASLTGTITLHTPQRLSLYYDAWERTGGVRGGVLRQGAVWELPCGRPLPLSGLFPPGFRWRPWVLEEVAWQVRARLAAGESWFEPDWERRLPRSFSPERFYLTEEGPVVFFPLCSIAPYAEGLPTFLLPVQKDAPSSLKI